MSFGLEWTDQAMKDLEKLEIFLRKRIVRKVLDFVEGENFHGVKRMVGYDSTYRLRVGNYRVVFEMMNGDIFVLKVGHREKIY